MTREHFTIDQVSWHTKRQENPERREQTINRFYKLTKFLQYNHITKEIMLNNINNINDKFKINTEDLTDDGYDFMRAAYEKWLRRVDRTMNYSDVRILERALKTLRDG